MSDSAHTQRQEFLTALFEGYEGAPFNVRFWDRWRWISPGTDDAAFTLVVNSPEALHSLIACPSEITLGEAFIHKEIDVEGDIFSVFDVAEHIFQCPRSRKQRVLEAAARAFLGIRKWVTHGKTHSIERDHAAISYHYDQPVDFFRPWLGKTMAYSCGYFESREDSIDEAQTNKLELICRKLRLQPGERFLDIGCGWGSLILHAGSRYKACAQGITISREQARVTAERIEWERLTQRCDVQQIDYRGLPERFPPFEKIASVGMFEHVGLKNMPIYFETAYRMLKPGGVFLNHAIARGDTKQNREPSLLYRLAAAFLGQAANRQRRRSASFIDRYVFPDGELMTISQAIGGAEAAHWEVRDVENLREHYELTLRRWVDGLQRNRAALLKLVPETAYRIWLLYMAGSAAAFRRGEIAIFQTLLSRREHGRSGLPLRREDWYASGVASEQHLAVR